MVIDKWEGAVWNSMFLGVEGAPTDAQFPDLPFTTLQWNPKSREKPFLFVNDEGSLLVHVPPLENGSSGISWTWSTGRSIGLDVPMSRFFIAKPSDPIATINSQLAAGKHLLFTPGVYNVDQTIHVRMAETVVLGLGVATLTAVNGVVPLKLADEPGIIVSGLAIDAGSSESSSLLLIGEPGSPRGDPSNPITLHDIYFRVGGPHIGKASNCLEVNSNHVLIDHTWIWRADHGVEQFDPNDGFDGDNQRWRINIGRNGAVVNGHDVTFTGLFVEHFQEYNLVWNGERGRVYFFQNELPYDPPSQQDWMDDERKLGWAGYKVNNFVSDHELWAGGVYCYNRNDPSIVTQSGFEAPVHKAAVNLYRIYTRNLSGPGAISTVLNGQRGGRVDDDNKGPEYLLSAA